MIVKDEAKTLSRCLQSVRGLVDEVIVVDTGSTDETVQIARREGAQVIHFPWVNDFAAARNEGLRRCTGDWVLILDADETIDSLDHARLRGTCQTTASHAFQLGLRNYHMSGGFCIQDVMAQENKSAYREGSGYPFFVEIPVLRLCRRSPDLAFKGRVHELLDPYFIDRGLPIECLPGVIIHHFGKLDEERETVKGRAYLDLALEDLNLDPDNSQFHFNVVQQGMHAQDWPVVLKSAEAYLKLRAVVPSVIHFGAGRALQKLERHGEAVGHFNQILDPRPDQAPALAYRGISLAALGREAEAERDFRRAIEINPRFALPCVKCMELLLKQGRRSEANEVIRRGVAHSPSSPYMHSGLLLLDLQSKDMDQAMEDARHALECLPQGGEGLWHRLAALQAHRAGQVHEAIRLLELGVVLFPGNTALRQMRDEWVGQTNAMDGS